MNLLKQKKIESAKSWKKWNLLKQKKNMIAIAL